MAAEGLPPLNDDPFAQDEGFCEENNGGGGIAMDPRLSKDGGGGRIRIDSALFIRVGDVPGISNKEARDDLEGDGEQQPPGMCVVVGVGCCASCCPFRSGDANKELFTIPAGVDLVGAS